jgi:ABC-2 type transport system permease protein
MNQARTVLWAQWRTYRNYGPAGRAILATVLNTLWYCAWVAGAVLAGVLMADRDDAFFAEVLPGALLLMFLYWQVVPLMMAATGASLDLRKLKVYPIPAPHLFLIEALLRTTAAVEMLLILTGASLGILWNPTLPAWAALAGLPFAAFNLLLSMGVRDLVLRLLSRRRVRELAMLAVVMLVTLPQFVLRGRDGTLERWLDSVSFPDLPPIWPWTATANLMAGADATRAAAVLAAWCLGAGLFAMGQFRRTLTFDAESAASAGGGTENANPGLLERLYRLPSTLLRDPLGALVEKEIRYLARSPRFRLVFLMGCAFGLIVARTFLRGSAEGPYWGPGYLTGVSVYSLLLLGEVCFWNSFGFDRSAAQIYFLAPVPFRSALAAKNITAAVFVILEIALAAMLCAALRIPVTTDNVLEALAVAGICGLLLLTAGNFLSVCNARGVDARSSMRTSASGRTQGLLLLFYPLAFAPPAIAYVARWLFESEVVFFAILGVIGAMAAIAYRIGLDAAAEDALERREAMIAALSRGQGPIAT